jgi:hypothetical protein
MSNLPVQNGTPWQSNEERLTSQAIASALLMSSDQIRALRPPIPRISFLPPRFGYRVDAIGIRDLIDINKTFPGARVDYSQAQSGYQGTSYPSLNQF